jgi:two-component system response regulator HydG
VGKPSLALDDGLGPAKILIVDDDKAVLQVLGRILRSSGAEAVCVSSAVEALAHLELAPVDVVLSDVQMPHVDGRQLLTEVRQRHPDIEVVLMSGSATVDRAVEALQAGAFHYLTKPIDAGTLVALLSRALERRRLRSRANLLERQVAAADLGLLGTSAAMERLRERIRTVAPTPVSILIIGESGVGKERVATAIHHGSDRRDRSFVAINCAALPENLLESELFGHEKGAFTGAVVARPGLFETASGGTLFLDEVGDMPLPLQAKLLRVLQEREVRRVGSDVTRPVDVRVVAATNVDLDAARHEHRFRDDLYYRLRVVAIDVPPLRAHSEDVPTLARHFAEVAAKRMNRPAPTLTEPALTALSRYAWPGNVRELINAMEHAVVLAGNSDEIDAHHLPETITSRARADDAYPTPPSLARLTYVQARKLAVEAFERRYAEMVLGLAGGNISEAARHAGMDRANFKRLLRRLHDSTDDD